MTRVSAIPVVAGRSYDVSAWVKTLGVSGGEVHVTVTFWDAAGVYLTDSASDSQGLSGSRDWSQLALSATAPTRAAFLRLELRLTGTGTFWADDLSVVAR